MSDITDHFFVGAVLGIFVFGAVLFFSFGFLTILITASMFIGLLILVTTDRFQDWSNSFNKSGKGVKK